MSRTLGYVSVAFTLIPVLVGWMTRRKHDTPLRIVWVYAIASFSTDVLAIVVGRMMGNNLWVMRVFTPVEFVLLFTSFALWNQRRSMRLALSVVTACYVVYFLVDYTLEDDMRRFASTAKTVSALLLVVVSAHALSVLRTRHDTLLTKEPFMWVASAVLLQYGASIVVYVVSNAIVESARLVIDIAWGVKSMTNGVAALMFAQAFRCLLKR